MKFVYIIRSIKKPNKVYIGVTGDLRRRFRDHNAGRTVHTSRFCPWKLETLGLQDDYDVGRAVSEAWNWLITEGLLVSRSADNSEWYILSRKAEKLEKLTDV